VSSLADRLLAAAGDLAGARGDAGLAAIVRRHVAAPAVAVVGDDHLAEAIAARWTLAADTEAEVRVGCLWEPADADVVVIPHADVLGGGGADALDETRRLAVRHGWDAIPCAARAAAASATSAAVIRSLDLRSAPVDDPGLVRLLDPALVELLGPFGLRIVASAQRRGADPVAALNAASSIDAVHHAIAQAAARSHRRDTRTLGELRVWLTHRGDPPAIRLALAVDAARRGSAATPTVQGVGAA
jgi:hypothetical protein